MLKPLVAGVDRSPDGAWAAAAAWRIAQMAGTQCFPVHAVREVAIPPGGVPGMVDEIALQDTLLQLARKQLLETLPGNVPEECLRSLQVKAGRPARVLAEIAVERDAGLIVVGGKRHSVLGRWLGGSTAHQTLRMVEIPLLVTTESAASIERILVAVDLSDAARSTIETAERYARLFGAMLRVVHVVEDVPLAVELPAVIDTEALAARVKEYAEQSIWPLVRHPKAERIVLRGPVRDTIEEETKRWGAQLVVIGSHGKGWVDRLLLGSVAEGLLNQLPASLLVVPTKTKYREPH